MRPAAAAGGCGCITGRRSARRPAGPVGRDYGDEDLGGWIDEYGPDAVLTGHVHESPFKPDGSWVDRIGDTWVFNAGHQIGPVPARIELDFTEGRATWVSLLGTEEVDLTGSEVPERSLF